MAIIFFLIIFLSLASSCPLLWSKIKVFFFYMWITWLTKEFHHRLLLSPLTTRRLLCTTSDTTREAWAERGNVWNKKCSTEDRPWQSPESIQTKHLSSKFLHSSHHPSAHRLTRVHTHTDSGCKFTRTLLSRSVFVLSVVDTTRFLPSPLVYFRQLKVFQRWCLGWTR